MDIKKALLLGLCIPALAFGVAACSDDDDSSDSTTTEQVEEAPAEEGASLDIVETAQATPDLTTLVDAVLAAELVETLQGEGPFTVFAPTNDAFSALPPESSSVCSSRPTGTNSPTSSPTTWWPVT